MRRWIPLVFLLVFAIAQPALAHPGRDDLSGHPGHSGLSGHPGHSGLAGHPSHVSESFSDGWRHPLHGADHLLAMVAVGLLAVRLGGRALWIMPCTFMGSMLIGGLFTAVGAGLPRVHYGIIEYAVMASVLVLGLLIAATKAVPLKFGAALVALFALFHGHAHAAEMAAGSSLWSYAAGFLLATALLHAAGVLSGLALSRWFNDAAVRISGGLISACGVLLICRLV